MVNMEVKWNLDLLQIWFTTELVNYIVVIPLTFPEDGVDKLGCGNYNDKKFIMGNAYDDLS